MPLHFFSIVLPVVRRAIFLLLLTGITGLAASVALPAQDLERIGESQPFTAGGSVAVRGVAYNANNISGRRQPFSWTLSGNVNAGVYDLSLPFSFTLGEQERSYSQPFNQFGISPHYKWLTAHLGYRSLTFSPYTLAGHQFLGAGLELTPGLFRVGLMYGRLQRAVERDTTTGNTVTPAYERTGYGGRIGYGTSSDYVDIIVFRAKDDAGSVGISPDSTGILPGENLVVGLSGRTEILSGVSLYFDGAVSDYTRDTRLQQLQNDNELTDALTAVMPARISTQLYTALRAGLTLSFESFGLNASFSRIDPDYQSMGAYAMNSDLLSVTVAPSLFIRSAGLRLSASVSAQRDNIQHKKAATTQRIFPIVAVSWTPSANVGLDVQYTDVMTSQEAGRKPLTDSLVLKQRMPMVSISPRYSIIGSETSHLFFVNGTVQILADDNRFTSTYSEYTSFGLNAAYTVSFVPQALSLSFSANTNRLTNFSGEIANYGCALGANKAFLENTLTSTAGISISFYRGGSTIGANLGGRYALTPQHAFNLELSQGSSKQATLLLGENTTFSEFTAVAGYVFTF